MAQVRNSSGTALFVPELNRVVGVDAVTDVPDDRLEAYLCQPATWQPVGAQPASEPFPAVNAAELNDSEGGTQ